MTLDKIAITFLALIILFGINAGAVNAQNQKPNDKDKKVQKEKDDDDDDDKLDSPEMQKELAKEAKISLEEARQKALARVPGTVIESELDKEKGIVVYEFEIKDKDNKSFDVLVDAKTGEIVGVEADDDDKDDGDDNSQAKQNKTRKWFAVWRKIPGLKKL
jgi:uncharacterized membrane protein YkoI